MEKTAGIEPDICYIEGGKLYLNYNKNVQNDWLSTMEADIVSADKIILKLLTLANFKVTNDASKAKSLLIRAFF